MLTRMNVNSLTLLPFPRCALKTENKKYIAMIDKACSCGREQIQKLSWERAQTEGWLRGLPHDTLSKAKFSPEGYALFIRPRIKPVQMAVVGDSTRSIQYARVTVDQLLRWNSVTSLPEVIIVLDWPDVPVRAAMRTLMCTRDTEKTWYFEEGLHNAEDIFRRMVDLKMNTFLFHSGWGEGLDVLMDEKGRRTHLIEKIIKSARSFNLDLGLVLVHDLEYGGRQPDYSKPYPCGMDPVLRKRRMHAFEQLVRAYPEVRYWLLHNQEHNRCQCKRCQTTSLGEEVLEYFHAYYKILRRLRPDAVMICCPYYQLGFPQFQLSYISGRWKEIGPEVRTCWWTDNYPLRPLPQFLTDVSECFEPYAFDNLPHAWHWFYMNGWSDFSFPCPEHFKSWIHAGLRSGHVECFLGEQSFYRHLEWNIRALAQFTWNSTLNPHDFDTLVLRTLFKTKSLENGRKHVEKYRALLTEFLAALFTKGYPWKEEKEPQIIRTFRSILKKTRVLESSFRKIILPNKIKPVDLTVDFLIDLAILGYETELRLKLRDAYMAWQKAEKKYDDNKKKEGEREFRRSLEFIRQARSKWQKLCDSRIARGNYYDTYMSAPVFKMERVFPDLLMTTELTLKMRRQGYHGYRPRWKEWVEIDKLWEGYMAFR